MNDSAAWRRLAAARVGVLGTIDADGAPHLVPFVFALYEPGRLVSVVDHKPKSTKRLQRLVHIERDPRVTVLAHQYEEDWARLWWICVTGEGVVIDRAPEEATRALIDKYRPYQAERPTGPWILIEGASIRSWSAASF